MTAETWAPVACTNAIACPVCPARRRERCTTDRPLHLERWDAWAAAGFKPASEARPMMRVRLRFWLAALDVAETLRAPLPVYLWLVARASNVTDWGPPIDAAPEGEGPW